MYFRNIVGQENVKKKLIQAVNESRIPHASLIMGPEGNGALPLTVAFVRYLFCSNRNENDSCGACPNCKKFDSLAHPDVHFSFPIVKRKTAVEKSDDQMALFREFFLNNPYMTLLQWSNEAAGENKLPLIPVEESASILRKLSLTAFEGGYKVMIIWQPDKMNPAAANKLLKILEEPPDKTLFFLVTEDESQLLRTIVSRTQIIKVLRPETKDIVAELKSRFGLAEAEASRIAFLSDNNFADALALSSELDQENSHFIYFRSLMRICFKAEVEKAIEWVAEMAQTGRENHRAFFAYSLEMTREVMMINFSHPSMIRLQGEELEFATKFAPFIHGANCEQLISELGQTAYFIERNANAKIVLLDLAFKIMSLLKVPAPNSQIKA